ncbi:endonuclease I family protein [Heyndrickxia coagulans]|jgi:deoxyribonuclease-1|uniref:endonuclease I family protein n=1 Tax=Heyndrickxia coagulans TaxID=1398 RepID=UPI00215B7CB4|nr:endonuclease [Heyndrickxia coagulans]
MAHIIMMKKQTGLSNSVITGKPESTLHPARRYLHFTMISCKKRTKTGCRTMSAKTNICTRGWICIRMAHPDGSVRNIYSGEARDPLAIIQEDHQIGKKRGDHYHSLLQESEISAHQIRAVDTFFKYNTEHIVPQSWFHAADPMKGDLHHLFVCYPSCNAKRSNLPYGDFDFYHPESADEPVRNHCGIAAEDKFEPESGKGTIARAFAYFLLHYPKAVSKSKLNRVNLSLLVQWHEVFPAGLYERHRNQAICRIQGNRNPFIDDAGLMKQLEGCLVKI